MGVSTLLGPWTPFLVAISGRVLVGLWLFCYLEAHVVGVVPPALRSLTWYGSLAFMVLCFVQHFFAVATTGPVPDTAVTHESGQFFADSVSWAVSHMRGWRDAMEDAHIAQVLDASIFPDTALFAVLDGHGGSEVSALASCLLAREVNAFGRELRSEGGGSSLLAALEAALPSVDAKLRAGKLNAGRVLPLSLHPFAGCGSTACVAAVDLVRREVVVANIGDSRAILIRNGKAIALSQDHKPEDKKERFRIQAAGGRVEQMGPCHRIDGTLNLSRAFGDFRLKANASLPPEKQKVIAVPDSTRTPFVGGPQELLVVACDGLFEKLSNQALADFVWPRHKDGMSFEQIGKELLHACCARSHQGMPVGEGTDNETVIIVKLPGAPATPAKTKAESRTATAEADPDAAE